MSSRKRRRSSSSKDGEAKRKRVESKGEERSTPSSTRAHYTVARADGEEMLLVRLLPEEGVTMEGICVLRVLTGCVSSLGSVLSPGSGSVPFYSSERTGIFVVEHAKEISNKNKKKSKKSKKSKKNKKNKNMDSDASDEDGLLALLEEPMAALLEGGMDEEHAPAILLLRSGERVNHFGAMFNVKSPGQTSGSLLLPGLRVRNTPNDLHSSVLLRLLPSWRATIDRVVAQPSPSVLLCGAKNTGKSTLSRCLLNSLLCTHKAVAFIECDVGQSEFTPSGSVSLNVVSSPVFGPAFTHQQTPTKSFFIGETSFKNAMTRYIEAIKALVLFCEDTMEGMPVLINTAGWIRGPGLDALLAIVGLALPNVVIGIGVAEDTELPERSGGYAGIPTLTSSALREHGVDEMEVHLVQPFVSTGRSSALVAAIDARELAVFTYFASAGSELAARRPFEVDLADVVLHFCSGMVPPSQALVALNATLVGLCVDPTGCAERLLAARRAQGTGGPHVVDELPEECECVGLGIIRAVDGGKGCLYVLPSPSMALEVLERVNVLVRGSLPIPPLMLLKAGRSHVPYLSAETVGAAEMKSRALSRKRLSDSAT